MLGVGISRGRDSPVLTFANQKKENMILFYPAKSDGYLPTNSPTSSTSCETSLDSSTYMEMELPLDHTVLSPSFESTLSNLSSKEETVLRTNKYCGSAYIKARKQRHEMRDMLLEYEDPPLDHLCLLAPSRMESGSSSLPQSSSQSKLVQQAALKLKQRQKGAAERERTSPRSPSSRWPQSTWKTGSTKVISAAPAKLPAVVKKHLEKSTDSIANDTIAKPSDEVVMDKEAAPPANTIHIKSSDATDTNDKMRKDQHSKIKARIHIMARSREERNNKRVQDEQKNDPTKLVKTSKTFKDFVDHLLMVSATNQLSRSPESTPSSCEKETLPPVKSMKRVSWRVNPSLPKPILERRTNSPDPQSIGRPHLPKPVFLTRRFASRPISDDIPDVPYDEEFDLCSRSSVMPSPGGWKAVFQCGSAAVLDSP